MATTPRPMRSQRRLPAGRPTGARGIVAAPVRERAPACVLLRPYVNGIAANPEQTHEVRSLNPGGLTG